MRLSRQCFPIYNHHIFSLTGCVIALFIVGDLIWKGFGDNHSAENPKNRSNFAFYCALSSALLLVDVISSVVTAYFSKPQTEQPEQRPLRP